MGANRIFAKARAKIATSENSAFWSCFYLSWTQHIRVLIQSKSFFGWLFFRSKNLFTKFNNTLKKSHSQAKPFFILSCFFGGGPDPPRYTWSVNVLLFSFRKFYLGMLKNFVMQKWPFSRPTYLDHISQNLSIIWLRKLYFLTDTDYLTTIWK